MARHRREDLRRDVVAAKGLGERDDAEPQRFPGFDARRDRRARAPARHPDDFRRAAADVEQDGRLGLLVGELAAAGRGEKGLGLAIDDLEMHAQGVAHPLKELPAVQRRIGRPPSRQPRPRDAARAHLVAADLAAHRACARSPLRTGGPFAKAPRRAGRCGKRRRRRESRPRSAARPAAGNCSCPGPTRRTAVARRRPRAEDPEGRRILAPPGRLGSTMRIEPI